MCKVTKTLGNIFNNFFKLVTFVELFEFFHRNSWEFVKGSKQNNLMRVIKLLEKHRSKKSDSLLGPSLLHSSCSWRVTPRYEAWRRPCGWWPCKAACGILHRIGCPAWWNDLWFASSFSGRRSLQPSRRARLKGTPRCPSSWWLLSWRCAGSVDPASSYS